MKLMFADPNSTHPEARFIGMVWEEIGMPEMFVLDADRAEVTLFDENFILLSSPNRPPFVLSLAHKDIGWRGVVNGVPSDMDVIH
jgi:hypothetical protein